jgi:2-methylcitrate dehydratase
MLHGQGKNSLFTDEGVQDPLVKDLMGKIKARANPALKETEANVKVRLKNGTEFSRDVSFPKGDPRNPLTFDEIEEKFRDLVEPLLPKKRMDQLVEMIHGLESLQDVGKLMKLCRFTRSRAG